MKKIFFVLLLIFSLIPSFSITFRYRDDAGRKYRFKNLIKQDIYRNGSFYSSVDMMTKATLEVLSVTNIDVHRKNEVLPGPFGFMSGKYYSYKRNANLNESFHLDEEYDSRFYRNPQGYMVISPEVLMPSLRSIPVFPTNDTEPGDSWTGVGEEIHEGILVKQNIMLFNVNVYYKYLGNEIVEGRDCARISIDYHIIHYPPKQDPDIFSFTGFSHSIYYWDLSNSTPVYYNEDYSFMFTLRNGETAYYTGTTEGKVDVLTDITNQQKLGILEEISNSIQPNPGMSVREAADGIVVSLGNILFDLNKANIKPDFENKLDGLAEVLRKYPQIDIVVSGHTDNTGTEKFNQSLSESRAKSAGDYLVKKGIAPSRISYIGFGSSQPLTDNSTEEKRTQNRRVEIKLITRE